MAVAEIYMESPDLAMGLHNDSTYLTSDNVQRFDINDGVVKAQQYELARKRTVSRL